MSALVILWVSELWDMILLREFKDVKQQRCSHNKQISVSGGHLVDSHALGFLDMQWKLGMHVYNTGFL